MRSLNAGPAIQPEEKTLKQLTQNVLVCAALVAGAMVVASPGRSRANAVAAGDTAQDFTLTDVGGTAHRLSQYRDSAAVVVVFIATQCPVSNAYNGRMVELASTYQPKGFQFLGINSNKQESVDEIVRHSLRNRFPFPVLKDQGNVVADQFGATRTPEVYVILPSRRVAYHGRIDDSQNEANIHSRDLKDALDAILAGRPVPRPETRAFGCTIKRVN